MVDKIRRIDLSPDEYIAGTFGQLTIGQFAMYWAVCLAIYSKGRPVDDDPARFAHALKCSTRLARSLIEQLVTIGKLERDANGQLSNGRARKELTAAERRVNASRVNGEKAANTHRTNAEKRRAARNSNGLGKPGGYSAGLSNHQPSTTNHQPHESGRQTDRDFFEHWEPTPSAVDRLRKARPDVVGELYDQRLADFRLWARRVRLSGDVEAHWLTFMRKTHKGERSTKSKGFN